MAKLTFITGGARSGKSRLAESLSVAYGEPLGYLATGHAGDGEMAERIARHQARRGAQWQTMEEPLDLTGVLTGHDGYFRAVLVDCVTLWLTNLLLTHDDPARVMDEVRSLAALLPTLQTPVILVSSEVGMGIVPENRLARTFRDLAGEANELLAAAADEVYVTFSGLPLKLKG
ncbi:bifunctional adenosylcobinamide kinase/adenosylcobinamide-phosphate guanylyltransferase [Geobacter sp. AOG1]|uniref:bifunctional adenosylcobinamide kinase/adenosylcobinamide-phosphate guanylyltransferase n=1 Tax=Geobacter sp. AOG1 TaxID=1566346 RepID=UPI001CC6F526|nr:bifunctional adenosylcobinamide kinase/adenosylcobinamide-phosphate guanylyltransferase [Geobacter sp. AOG1]GFE56521.1 adenosylcobinamide kinase/adenosylcobinamidephosphate guanyltransferase [Geobacter sp. AOG1]